MTRNTNGAIERQKANHAKGVLPFSNPTAANAIATGKIANKSMRMSPAPLTKKKQAKLAQVNNAQENATLLVQCDLAIPCSATEGRNSYEFSLALSRSLGIPAFYLEQRWKSSAVEKDRWRANPPMANWQA
jgi:hypothetical protein